MTQLRFWSRLYGFVMQKYFIKRLQWGGKLKKEFDCLSAETPFGSYQIHKTEDGYRWGFCFDEHWDEGQYECGTIKEGKERAYKHWCDRLMGALREA